MEGKMRSQKIGIWLGAFMIVLFCMLPAGGQQQSVTICGSCGGNNGFMIQSYQGKSRCLDYTPGVAGSPVVLNDCSASHAVTVEETKNARHDVVLHAGNLVIGFPGQTIVINGGAITAASAPPPSGAPADMPLVLVDPLRAGITTQAGTIGYFELDGDSIMLGSDRTRVVQAQNARGRIGSPIVLGQRELRDSEFWDFVAMDGTGRDPSSDFVRVSTAAQMANAALNAHWGTVIKVDPQASIGLLDVNPSTNSAVAWSPLIIPAGVTIRGNRRGMVTGAELFFNGETLFESPIVPEMMIVDGDYVRITGLRLSGPSTSTDDIANQVDAILIRAMPGSSQDLTKSSPHIAIVDHNDISGWPNAAVEVLGDHPQTTCTGFVIDPSTEGNVRIERNFLHHNQRWGGGYGAAMTNGGRAVVIGNTSLKNRHTVAADGTAYDEYRAWYNLILSDQATYGLSHEPPQVFDMHGTSGGWGGIAGNQVDLAANTSLVPDDFSIFNRPFFELRAVPCVTDYVRDNVTVQHPLPINYQYGIVQTMPGPFVSPVSVAPSSQAGVLLAAVNESPSGDPTATLAVGDFDGDGVDDLFLATGAGWYYSPGGKAEWRFLSARTDTIQNLLFGDFDGDGRTDVLGQNGNNLMVSWGGVSDWEVLNQSPGSIHDMAVGDFLGDGRSDIFYANGNQWFISDGGTAAFLATAGSSYRVSTLRFADFDGDGKTDVFGVVGGNWSYSKSGSGPWTKLRPALTKTVDSLVVADFDGDGHADIFTSVLVPPGPGQFTAPTFSWLESQSGIAGWQTVISGVPALPSAAGIGHFTGNRAVDVLLWASDNDLNIVQGGRTALPPHYSTQEMR
jgi:hypothetical protein